MAKFTGFALFSAAQNLKTGDWETCLHIGRYPHSERATEAGLEFEKEAFPYSTHGNRFTTSLVLPREFFEEVIDTIGDLRTLTEMSDDTRSILDDEILELSNK